MTIDGRSPHGERGLKFRPHRTLTSVLRRSPHGERGLKSFEFTGHYKMEAVAPLTGSVD